MMAQFRPSYVYGLVLLAGCQASENGNAILRNRITAGNASQYCRPDACYNPSILAVENEYDVTTFEGKKPVLARVRIERLRSFLLGLPMTAWPRGPAIVITPTDIVRDGQVVQRNLKGAESVCRQLGLDVQVRPGG